MRVYIVDVYREEYQAVTKVRSAEEYEIEFSAAKDVLERILPGNDVTLLNFGGVRGFLRKFFVCDLLLVFSN